MDKLKGRVALITGASRGIGRGIALAYAREGACVGVNYHLSQAEAFQVVDTIQSSGGKAIALKADVTKPDRVQGMVETVLATFGRVDILVNNAGTLPAGLPGRVPFTEMTLEYWDAYIDLNLRSVFICTKAVLPTMLSQGYGRIINIGSEMSFKGSPHIVAYCAAKGGVVSFTRALARSLAECGITVNTIAPGPIMTDAHKREGETEEMMKAQAATVPLKRFASVDEVSPTAVLLASSPDGDFYTGVTFHPNGGDVMI